jgi:hypothetical protein
VESLGEREKMIDFSGWKELPQNLHIRETPLEPAYTQISSFTDSTEAVRVLGTLWPVGTWIYRAFGVYPRLFLTSEEPESGKTTALQVVTDLSQKGISLAQPTERWTALWIEENPTSTIGIDEVDKIYRRPDSRPTLTGLINQGYKSTGRTGAQRDNRAVLLPVYCPVVMSGIGNPLPPDLFTRCITLVMTPGIPELQYRPDTKRHDLMMHSIGEAIGELLNTESARKALSEIAETHDELAPIPGSTRTREITFPLFAIATLLGMRDQFLKAWRDNSARIDAEPVRPTWEMLRDDIREMWPEEATRLSASEIINLLASHPSQRWGRSLPNDAAGAKLLASALGQVGISTTAGHGERGYSRRAVFAD